MEKYNECKRQCGNTTCLCTFKLGFVLFALNCSYCSCNDESQNDFEAIHFGSKSNCLYSSAVVTLVLDSCNCTHFCHFRLQFRDKRKFRFSTLSFRSASTYLQQIPLIASSARLSFTHSIIQTQNCQHCHCYPSKGSLRMFAYELPHHSLPLTGKTIFFSNVPTAEKVHVSRTKSRQNLLSSLQVLCAHCSLSTAINNCVNPLFYVFETNCIQVTRAINLFVV